MKNLIETPLNLHKLILMYTRKFNGLDTETILILREILNDIIDERSEYGF